MTQSSHQLFDVPQLPGSGSRLAAPRIPREFEGIPGIRNSQALRDWIRATGDLDRANHLHAAPETIAELHRAVVRAYARLQALSARRR
jgi:hypothetical protein